jgi:hypothetical protein
VRVLFHAFQAQGNPAKICCGHVAIPIRQREYRISPLADGMCPPRNRIRATWKATSGLLQNAADIGWEPLEERRSEPGQEARYVKK